MFEAGVAKLQPHVYSLLMSTSRETPPIAGYGLKIETDTGYWVWLTANLKGKQTTTYKRNAMKFDSQEGATQYAQLLSKQNGNITILVVKF